MSLRQKYGLGFSPEFWGRPVRWAVIFPRPTAQHVLNQCQHFPLKPKLFQASGLLNSSHRVTFHCLPSYGLQPSPWPRPSFVLFSGFRTFDHVFFRSEHPATGVILSVTHIWPRHSPKAQCGSFPCCPSSEVQTSWDNFQDHRLEVLKLWSRNAFMS